MFPNPLEELLDLYSLEELFEVLEIEPYRVLEILYEGGYISIPDFLDHYYDQRRRTSEET